MLFNEIFIFITILEDVENNCFSFFSEVYAGFAKSNVNFKKIIFIKVESTFGCYKQFTI